jgi:hypothetical protein
VQVREARDAAREAAALLQELQRFVQDEGPDGDWQAWVSSHVAYAGKGCWQRSLSTIATAAKAATSSTHTAPVHALGGRVWQFYNLLPSNSASCGGSAYNQEHCAIWPTHASLPSAGCVTPTSSSAQQSPLRSNTSDLESRMSLTMLRTSPISERFQQAAVQQNLIAEPGSNRGSAAGTAQQERPDSADSCAAGSVEVAAAVEGDEEAAAAAAGFEVTLHLPDEQQQQQEEDEQQQQVQPQLQQQPSRRQWSRNNSSSSNRPSSSAGQAPSSRPGSCATASRPGSAANSRRCTAEQQVPKRQSSHNLVPATSAAAAAASELNAAVQQAGEASGVASDAAAAEPLPVQALRRVTSGAGVQRPLSRASSRARTGAGVAAAAPGRTNAHLLSVFFVFNPPHALQL